MVRTNRAKRADPTTRLEARSIEDLAAEQGVQAATDFEALLGDFWPDDESVDEFISAVRLWRTEGND